jgi:hypothetical protein
MANLIKAVDRFITRLHLPADVKVNIQSIRELNCKPTKSHSMIELYHSPRCTQFGVELDDVITSIETNGFVIHNTTANKGKGIYFANHSRYAWLWGGSTVMICHVLDNPSHIKRYRSEVESGSTSCNSEYVVNNPDIIYPQYLLKYSIDRSVISSVIKSDSIYVKHGFFGCIACDKLQKRCDCPLHPTIHPNDIIRE